MWKFPQSQTFTNGDQIELGAGENIWVSKYVLLAHEAADAISADTANHTVLIDGAVASNGTAIAMLGYFSSGNVVSISETGIVRGAVGVYQGGINSETSMMDRLSVPTMESTFLVWVLQAYRILKTRVR